MRVFIVVLIAVFSITRILAAESAVHVGAYFSYGGAAPTVQQSKTACDCPTYNDIRGDLIAGGVAMYLPLSVGDGFSLGLLGQFGYGSIALGQVIPLGRIPSLDPDGNVVYSTMEYQLSIDQQGVLLDAAADLTYSGLTIDIGVTALFSTNVTGRNTLELVDPPDAEFDPFVPAPGEGRLEDEDTYVLQEWDESAVSSVSYGVYGAIGYTHDFGIITTTLAAESRFLWVVAIPDATAPLWTYGGVLRVMLDL